MSRIRTALALAVLPLVAVLGASGDARAERLPIRSYTTAEGLPHNRVKRIVVDTHGFLWLCTTEGLARFDGHAFVAYGTAQGLPVPSTNDILELDGKGYWVATNGGGVAFLDPNGGARTRFAVTRVGDEPASSRVNVLHRDRQGRLWAGTDGGLFRRDSAEPGGTGAFARVPLGLAGHPEPVVQIWAMLEDDAGTLWAGTKYGLVGVAGTRVLHHPIAPRETDHVLALLREADGRIWAGHETAGLLLFDPSVLRAGGPPARSLTRADGLAGDTVNALHRSGGALCIGTSGGLSVLADEAGAPVRSYTTAHGLAENLVSALAEDRGGNLWIGTSAGGAMRLARSGFVTYGEEDGLGHAVSNVFTTTRGELCATSTNWLVSRFDGRGFTTVRPRLPAGLPPTRWRFFQSTIEDHLGDWWIATGEGLCRFAKPARVEELAERAPSAVYTTKDGLASDDVSRLFEDSRGDVWIGSFTPVKDGVTRFRRASGAFERFGEGQGLPALVSVSEFAEDTAKDVWIALREGGLVRFRDGSFRLFGVKDGFPPSPVVAIHADPAGPIWMSTAGSGLARVDAPASEHPRVTLFGAKQGIDLYYLSGLTQDREGRVYVGTSHDLRRLEPASGTVKHFGAGDGVVSSEVVAAHCDTAGALWFGSWRGLSRFVPAPDREVHAPLVRIGALGISGVPYPVSDLGAPDVSLGRLAPNQNLVQIEFFSLGSGDSAVVRYEHRLEGADRDWSQPSDLRTISYANLGPGRYRFQVRAVSADRLVSPAPATVSFTILPPLWRRWWFLLAAAFLVGAAVYAGEHARAARRLEVERVRTRIASDLHDDIGASLSRIAVLTEVLKRKAGPEHAERLGSIADLARELVVSMSDIVWATDPRRDDLKSVTRRLRAFASDVLEARGIAFECRVAPECEDVRLGPEPRRHVYLILKEAVSNVAKHSGATDARLAFSTEGSFLVAELRDDGQGLPVAGPLSSGFSHGTVHGLPNMKERAEAAGGTFEIVSVPARGTVIRLRIPIGKEKWPA